MAFFAPPPPLEANCEKSDTTAGPWARGPMVAVQLGHDGWINTTDPVLRL
jgi:hypothetical protein